MHGPDALPAKPQGAGPEKRPAAGGSVRMRRPPRPPRPPLREDSPPDPLPAPPAQTQGQRGDLTTHRQHGLCSQGPNDRGASQGTGGETERRRVPNDRGESHRTGGETERRCVPTARAEPRPANQPASPPLHCFHSKTTTTKTFHLRLCVCLSGGHGINQSDFVLALRRLYTGTGIECARKTITQKRTDTRIHTRQI